MFHNVRLSYVLKTMHHSQLCFMWIAMKCWFKLVVRKKMLNVDVVCYIAAECSSLLCESVGFLFQSYMQNYIPMFKQVICVLLFLVTVQKFANQENCVNSSGE